MLDATKIMDEYDRAVTALLINYLKDSRSLVLSDNACSFVQAVPGLPYDFARFSAPGDS